MKQLLLFAIVCTFSGLARAAEAKKPNVLFIAVDDLRDWVGYLGRNPQTKTPHIDRLASMGVAFTRSYCAAPVCNPSRAALLSGRRPSTSGVYDNDDDWRKVTPEPLTLTHAFRTAGYSVRGAGKIHHEGFPRPGDWDDYFVTKRGSKAPNKLSPQAKDEGVGALGFAPLDCADAEMPDYQITDYAIAELGKRHDRPFFLAVGLYKPHLPWNVPQKYFDMFPLGQIVLPPYREDDLDDLPRSGVAMARPQNDHAAILKSGRWKEAVQGYLAATAFTDMNIGRLLDALEKSPEKDNTIICFWGDHGWHLGEKHHWRKFALWEEATRAPLIWVAPGVTKPGGVCARTVDFMSIFPTLTDLCGLPTPPHVEGTSLRALLADPQAAWDRPALTTHRFKNHAVRTEEWRYIRYANGDEELYHELSDPNEWTNLARDPKHAATKAQLATRLPVHDEPAVGGKVSAKEMPAKKTPNDQ